MMNEMNELIFNSRILVDKSTPTPVKQQAFHLELVDTIMQTNLPHVPQQRRRVIQNRDARLTDLRFLRLNFHCSLTCAQQMVDGQSVGRVGPFVGGVLCDAIEGKGPFTDAKPYFLCTHVCYFIIRYFCTITTFTSITLRVCFNIQHSMFY